MDSPISPLFDDMVMDNLERDCLHKLKDKDNCTPLLYYRYADDTIVCIKRDHIDVVLKVFNNYNPHRKFIHEIEIDNSINFLDLNLTRNNNHIYTNRYQKPTTSSRLLNYNSNHTLKQKRNIISNLTDRTILLSDTSFLDINIVKIKQVLICNDYPESFINTHIKNRLQKIKFNKKRFENTTDIQPKTTISIPLGTNFF